MIFRETEGEAKFTTPYYQSENSEFGGQVPAPKPSALGRAEQLLAVLGLTRQFGIVHCSGRIEFTAEYRLVFETDDAIEAMQHLEECIVGIPPEESCFLLLNQEQ